MEFNMSSLTFPDPFLKRLSTEKDLEVIYDNISIIGEREDFTLDESKYYFVISILAHGLKPIYDKDIFESLFYEVACWASSKETKQKIRPKSFADVKSKKSKKHFTKLSKALTLALIKEYIVSKEDGADTLLKDNFQINYIKFQDELSIYTNLLYEISCIRRIRNAASEDSQH